MVDVNGVAPIPTPYSAVDANPMLYSQPNNSGSNSTLMQWGPLQFQIWPLNFHELDHETSTDWAKKEIAGAAVYREWVGENDEVITIQGRLFPYKLGGMSSLDAFEALRRAGAASTLVRGSNPGVVMGWFVCEHLTRQHQFITVEGVGQVIEFTAQFARVPMPAAETYITQLWGAIIGA